MVIKWKFLYQKNFKDGSKRSADARLTVNNQLCNMPSEFLTVQKLFQKISFHMYPFYEINFIKNLINKL